MAETLKDQPFILPYAFVSLFHVAGLSLLCKAKRRFPNQRILTMNLAATEMFWCLNMVVLFSTIQYLRSKPVLDYFLHFFTVLLYVELRLTMLHTIIDRFLEIHTTIKYPHYMTKKKVKIIMASLWLVSGVCASISLILKSEGHRANFHLMLSLVLDILIFFGAAATYGYFFRTVFKLKKLESSLPVESRTTSASLLIKKFAMSCYIVFTYICFNLASTALITYNHYTPREERNSIILELAHTAIILGFVSDVTIYIFANKNVRVLICSLCRKRDNHVTGETNDTI